MLSNIYFTILLFSFSMISRSESSLVSVAWTSWLMPTSFFRRASLLAAYSILVLTFASSGHLNNKRLKSLLHHVPSIEKNNNGLYVNVQYRRRLTVVMNCLLHMKSGGIFTILFGPFCVRERIFERETTKNFYYYGFHIRLFITLLT